MSQPGPSFPGAGPYPPSSSKLPDRTAVKTGSNPTQRYTQSALGRRPDQSYQFAQSSGAPQPQHGALGPRSSMEKESNVLSELSEEQRDEINEAVWDPVASRPHSDADKCTDSLICLTSIEIVTSTTMNFESLYVHSASPCLNPKYPRSCRPTEFRNHSSKGAHQGDRNRPTIQVNSSSHKTRSSASRRKWSMIEIPPKRSSALYFSSIPINVVTSMSRTFAASRVSWGRPDSKTKKSKP